jgi:hypothetical protein
METDPWTVQPVTSHYTDYTTLAASETQVLNELATQEHSYVQFQPHDPVILL